MDLKTTYLIDVVPNLKNEFKGINPHEIPKIVKIIISSGLGLNGQNKTYLKNAVEEYRQISGQHPVISLAKKSIASFKTREGMPTGLFVTLRRKKMYSFLEKIIKIILPRVRDFRGLSPKNFDKAGNFSFGIVDQLVFPEVDYENIDKQRGYNITIVTNTKNKERSFFLLRELGIPFSKL